MPIFAMKSLSQSCSLENAAADYRTARRAGQYRVSGEAIYFPAFPGPLSPLCGAEPRTEQARLHERHRLLRRHAAHGVPSGLL